MVRTFILLTSIFTTPNYLTHKNILFFPIRKKPDHGDIESDDELLPALNFSLFLILKYKVCLKLFFLRYQFLENFLKLITRTITFCNLCPCF